MITNRTPGRDEPEGPPLAAPVTTPSGREPQAALDRGRLNRVIDLIERGSTAFGTFLPAGSVPDALWAATCAYDFVVYELEHNVFNLSDLRLSLQFMLNRRQIAGVALDGRLGPDVMPFVRVPINGREHSEWIVKQVLDIGVYGVVFPMINTVEDARHVLQACRYPQAEGVADVAPVGRRGHSPDDATRYWGLSWDEYFDRADVWPLDARGEILPILQCETAEGVANLPAICRDLKTPGLILISTGDLSVSLGCKGNYTPKVEMAVQEAVRTCREHGVPYGTPHLTAENVEQRIADGFQFLMTGVQRDVSTLTSARRVAGRTDG